MQAARRHHLVVQRLPLAVQLRHAPGFFFVGQTGRRLDDRRLPLDVAAQHDVGCRGRHVGGDGDHLRPARLRHDFRLARVLLGVQHLVRKFLLFQQARQQFRVLDRSGADQHRLPALVAIVNVVDDRLVFFARRAIDLVHAVSRTIGLWVGITTVSRP